MSSARPAVKAAIHASSVPTGSAIDSKKPTGDAPLAARSDRFIRSTLRAMLPGGSLGRKCTPAMTPSAVKTTSQSAGGVSTAASSPRSNAPGAVASGRKYRPIRRSSPEISCAEPSSSEGISCPSLSAGELAGAELVRELIEHGIDHPGLFLVDKSAGHVDIFRGYHACRHVAPVGKFIGAGPQHRAKHGFDPFERPAIR